VYKFLFIFIGYIGGNSQCPTKEDNRVILTKNTVYELDEEEFTSRSKDGIKGVFTRDRKLPLKNLVILIMSSCSSIQRDLDRFFKSLDNSDFNIRKVTKSAFTQARKKLNPWAFKRLNEVAVKTFYENNEVYTWYGMRVMAVDGSRLVLPNHQTVREEFGVHKFGPNADSERSLALCSVFYDVLNLLAVDSQIAPYASSERDLLYKHLEYAMDDDLILLDRGYPSKSLFFLLLAKKLHFCVRMKDDWWLEVDKFKKSGMKEHIVSFKLPKKDRNLLKDYPEWQDKEIKCRLIKVELPSGESEILCTSLIDMEKHLYDDFVQLYHYRWNEEEAYKLLKCRVEVENFSGKTAIAVKQDFYAKMYLLTLCSAYAHPIDEKVREEYKADENRKHDQKINRTNAIAMTKDILIAMFVRKDYNVAIHAFDDVVSKTREIIRPGRSNERNHRPKKLYSMNYKRL
jgi:hypothetical protein